MLLETHLTDKELTGSSSIQLFKVIQSPKHSQIFLQGCCFLSPAKKASRRSNAGHKSNVVFNTEHYRRKERDFKAKRREAHPEGNVPSPSTVLKHSEVRNPCMLFSNTQQSIIPIIHFSKVIHN